MLLFVCFCVFKFWYAINSQKWYAHNCLITPFKVLIIIRRASFSNENPLIYTIVGYVYVINPPVVERHGHVV